ncbi:MAG: beta-lactamase family protein [Planctomycetes bacterium]|nr:beta-lactamase family protein [Planctomycetota bacterium]
MTPSLLTYAALLLPFSACPAQQDPPRLVVGAVGERIARFAEAAAGFGFAGAVLAARDGKVVVAVGVGSADLAGKVPNDARTLFELASVTKQFTAAAILVLVQQGKLKLDDPMHAHLPGVPDDCRTITIRHLLQHTSGIPGSNAQGSGDDLAVVLPKFLAGGPKHAPGTHWEYWNQGYALLAEIVARASGEEFTTFCARHLFAPAKATTACFTGDPEPAGVVVAIGRGRGAPRAALAHPYGSYGFQYKGMGGAVASVWDLWHWDRALRGETVLQKATKQDLFAPGLNDYALGWFVKRRDGRLAQSHGGSVRGFLCDVRRLPDQDAFIAVLCCRDDGPMGEVANGVEALLFGDKREVPKPLPADTGAALVGTWQSERGKLSIEAYDGRLRATVEWTQYPPTRGFVAGPELGKATLFDWHSELPLAIERRGDQVAAIRLAGLSFRRT